jgi:hypothetical protein
VIYDKIASKEEEDDILPSIGGYDDILGKDYNISVRYSKMPKHAGAIIRVLTKPQLTE